VAQKFAGLIKSLLKARLALFEMVCGGVPEVWLVFSEESCEAGYPDHIKIEWNWATGRGCCLSPSGLSVARSSQKVLHSINNCILSLPSDLEHLILFKIQG